VRCGAVHVAATTATTTTTTAAAATTTVAAVWITDACTTTHDAGRVRSRE
jgi:hypothetical protein